MKWWQFKKRAADLECELQSDLDLEEEEQRDNGLPPEEARYAALRAFGNSTLIREQTHEAWDSAAFERLAQNVRYAVRQLRRSPGFSVVTVATLALGIGATTAIFTLVYDVMLRPLPFPQADRLVTIEEKVSEWSNIYPTLPVSANHFTFWQQNNRSFDSMAIMQQGSLLLGAGNRPLQVGVVSATPGVFSVLRVQPQLGRAFSISEAQPGHERVAVLMYDLWREQFSADPHIVGKTIRLNGFPYTVVGVMPQSFHMPSVQTMAATVDTNRPLQIGILEPLTFSKERLAEEMGDLNYFGLGRLKTGISVAAATADLDTLQHTISANLPADEMATLSAALMPFQQELVGNNRKPLIILLAAVAGLLMVGCVNVTNLLLARAVGQKQQMAVAAALGARRAELVRMALRETAVLAVVGGGLGILLAAGIVPAMQHYLPPALDFRGPLHLDWTGAGCALLLAVLATLLAGAAPAFMISRTAPQEVLHSNSRLASESRGSRRARRVLVGIEVAVSVALVLMSGLLTTSVVNLLSVDRGFTVERTMTAMIDLPLESYRDDLHRAAFYRDVLERMDRLPGVERAAFTSVLPLTGDGWGDFARVEGDNRLVTQLPLESFRSVSPEYFSAIHLRLISGKIFTQGDWGKNLALVSEKTAKTLWPGKNPVGLQFRRGDRTKEQPFTVVGVVANARTISLAKPDPMLIYVPYWYRCEPTAGLVVRTRQDPSEMGDAIRQTIWSVDRSVPVPTVRSLGGVVADSVANQRFEMDLLLLFAASALFLAGLGVYGVLTYSVAQRHREIGLRLALGAQRASVYRLVLREGLLPVAIGATAGVALVFGSARVVSSLLFQVSPYDPALTAGAVCVLLAIGTAACLLPARRAAAVEPMQSLRTE
ncbi:MAG TPA: ABC transporter permease [Terracidiphilus sp.]|jgi:putative ABC transport system permease protein|nr:ABC transporter permease [Terracidiphilus sp.]